GGDDNESLRAVARAMAFIVDDLTDEQRLQLMQWFFKPEAGLRDLDFEVRIIASELYLRMNKNEIASRAIALNKVLSRDLDSKNRAEVGAEDSSPEFAYQPSDKTVRILAAAFARPSSWGPPSDHAPDVALVSSHDEV